jgi:hypothetical protein
MVSIAGGQGGGSIEAKWEFTDPTSLQPGGTTGIGLQMTIPFATAVDAGVVSVAVCDGLWTRRSGLATHSVINSDLQIFQQPVAPEELRPDNSVLLEIVAAGGVSPPTFQWQFEDGQGGYVDIPGANGTTLTLTPDSGALNGEYRCVVFGQNQGGPVTLVSDLASLSVLWVNNPANGHWYKRTYGPSDWGWGGAYFWARGHGGYLATLDDLAEVDWLLSDWHPLHHLPSAWVGLNDLAWEGRFIWVDGTAGGVAPWAADEPNDFGGREDAVEVIGASLPGSGLLFDKDITSITYAVMERNNHPNDPPLEYVSDCVSDPRGWVYNPGTGHWYKRTPDPQTWINAAAIASVWCGYLVEVNDAMENTWLTYESGLLEGTGHAWTGLADSLEEGRYTWPSGNEAVYTNWREDEPNDLGGDEDYVTIIGDSLPATGYWNDSNFFSVYPAIIERESPPCEEAEGDSCSLEGEGGADTCATGLAGWVHNPTNGHWYRLTEKPANWLEARQDATQSCGYLATMSDAAENEWLSRHSGLLDFEEQVWIGLSDAGQEGHFVWDDGTPYAFQRWRENEPNDAGDGEDFVAMTGGLYPSAGYWNDEDFLEEFFAVVERDTHPCGSEPDAPGCSVEGEGAVESCVIDGSDWVENPANEHWYALTPMAVPWIEANLYAKTVCGYLVTINDAAETDWLVTESGLLNGQARLWTGLNDAVFENSFSWVGGGTLSYTNWQGGTPLDNNDGRDFVSILGNALSSSGQWRVDDGNTSYAAIVERNFPPGEEQDYPDGEGKPEGEIDGEMIAEGAEEGAFDGEGGEALIHSADQNHDGIIDFRELLRVVQLFNAGAYHCDDTTEDGYSPGTGPLNCSLHDGDYAPEYWRIELSELLRLIQFFNTYGYRACSESASEDGFCVPAAQEVLSINSNGTIG